MKTKQLAQRQRRLSLNTKESRRRRLRVECLEDRRLLAFDVAELPLAETWSKVEAGDLNVDGYDDFVLMRGDKFLVGSHGQAIGSAAVVGETALNPGSHPLALGLGDSNSDGKLDVLVGKNHTGVGRGVLTFEGDNAYGFNFADDISNGGYYTPIYVETHDFNQDGINEIITSNYNNSSNGGVTVIFSDGTIRPLRPWPIYHTNGYNLIIDDLNQDGFSDIAVPVGDPENLGPTGLAIMLSDGGTNFSESFVELDPSEGQRFGVSADLDGDGAPEILVADALTNSVHVYQNNGAGGFSTASDAFSFAGASRIHVLEDLPGSDFGVRVAVISRSIGVGVFNYSRASQQWAHEVTLDGEPLYSNVGDFNGDGNNDIVVIEPGRLRFFYPENAAKDYGDAPAPYPVTFEEGGARHDAIGPHLGPTRTLEANGIHSDLADADTDDGVTFGELRVGETDATVTVNVQNAPLGAKIDAWIDFNGDGNWGGPQEQIFDSIDMVNGDNELTFDIPAYSLPGETFARFRLSTDGQLGLTGASINGEVEDFAVSIAPANFTTSVQFSSVIAIGNTQTRPEALATGDIDSDGDTDLLVASRDGLLKWYENDNSELSGWVEHTISTDSFTGGDVYLADIDGDNDLDAIIASESQPRIVIHRNVSAATNQFEEVVVATSIPSLGQLQVGDLDSDGDADIVAASTTNDAIYVFENPGEAGDTFTQHTVATAVDGARGVTLSDLNGDGFLDIIGTAIHGDYAFWLRADSQASWNYQFNTIATNLDLALGVSVTDVDGDGDQDVIVASRLDNTVAWYENLDGSAQSFSENLITTSAIHASYAQPADIDGDGDMDILVSSVEDDGITLWLNTDGTGKNFVNTYQTKAIDYPINATPVDVDGDGLLDIVAAGFASNNVVWIRNIFNHLPTLDALTNITIDEDAGEQSVNLAGISAGGGESQPLRVTASSSNAGLILNPTVTYTSAEATGTLKFTPIVEQGGVTTITVTVEDGGLDGDLATAGDNLSFSRTFDVTVNAVNDVPTLDAITNLTINEDAVAQTVELVGIRAGGGESQPLLVTGSSSNTGLILEPTVTYNSADTTGTLQFTPIADQSGVTTITVTVEDGGLDLDLATTADNATFSRTFDVTVNPVNDPPTLADYSVRLEHSQTSASFLYGMTAADFNNDGLDDFVGSYYFSPNAGLHITPGSPTYSGETTFHPLGNLSREVQHADIDGDGDMDLIASNYASHSQGDGRLYVLSNDGTGSFSTTFVNVPGTSPGGIAHGDFDNDGDIDVAMAMHHSNTWRLLDNDGTGTFTVAESYGVATPEGLVAADVNSDGWIDVVSTNLNGDQFVVFLNDQNGGFNTGQQIAAGDYPSSIAAGDFNGDNHIDLVVSNQVPDTLSVFVNNGAGVFSPADVFPLGDSGNVIQVAINDWDQDGVDDIIALSEGTPGSTLFFISPLNGTAIEHSVANNGVNVVAGDFDGDSQIEYAVSTWVLARNPSLLSFYELSDTQSDLVIFEDDSETTKPLGGIGPGPNENQTLRVTATSSNESLIPNPEVTYKSPETNGLLKFAPVANANGRATITVTVEDAGLDNDLATTEDNATFSRSFDVTVNPVNDVPVLDSLPDVVIAEDGVVHGNGTNLSLFASDIDSDESKLEFRIVNLAEIDPQFGISIGMDPQSDSFAVRGDSSIHVHPADNFSGSTQVTIEVKDPEGDVSDQQTFNLVINAVNDPPVLNPARDLSLSDLIEDSGAPVGQVGSLISTLIDENGPLSNYTDIDGIAPGIAVVGKNIAIEKIWFSTDDGQNWQEAGSVSEAGALVLVADELTRIYLQTADDASGELVDALTIKAWDQTGGGSNGQAGVDSTSNAFSSQTDTVSLSVEPSSSSAADDFYSPLFDGGETFVISKADLIANDALGNGESIDTVTITADATSVAGGTITVDGDQFTYTRPATWFSGIDTFSYTLDDGGSISTATVTILSGLQRDTLTITLEPGRDHDVTLQYVDGVLVMLDHVTQETLLNIPTELVPANVDVIGAPENSNIVTFRDLSGATPDETSTSWSYAGGSVSDELVILGTGNQWAWLSSDPQVENDVTVDLKFLTTLIDSYTMIAVEKVSIAQVDRVEFSDPYLEVGAQTFELGSTKPVNLPTDVTISEGTLRSSTPVGPHVGESIVGSGQVDAVFAGGVGSLIRATGNLVVGSTSDSDGFRTDGRLEVGANSVTLLDSNQASLGELTRLGDGISPGTLISDHGLAINFTGNLEGYGTIQTAPDGTFINNGNVIGTSSDQPITINSRVKGVGTFDNVVMNGEFRPGFSPALWKSGTVAYTDLNRFVIELGGRLAGAEFDRVEHYLAKLGGTLDVQLIDGFKPALGDLFEVITSQQPFEGDFSEVLLPTQINGVRIRELVGQHGIELETVFDVADTLKVLKSQVSDYEIAGHDGSNLKVQGDRFRAFVTSQHQFVAQHPWHTEQLELDAGKLVQVATDGVNRVHIEGSNWKNFVEPSDINNDRNITALDALTVVNELGRRSHSDNLTSELYDSAILVTGEANFYDQNGDGKCTALDALRVINDLARGSVSGEGEAVTADYLSPRSADIWSLVIEIDEENFESEFEEAELLYSDAEIETFANPELPEDFVYATVGQESTEAVDSLLSDVEDWWKQSTGSKMDGDG